MFEWNCQIFGAKQREGSIFCRADQVVFIQYLMHCPTRTSESCDVLCRQFPAFREILKLSAVKNGDFFPLYADDALAAHLCENA